MLEEKLKELSPFLPCEETVEYLKIVSEPSDVGEVHHILPASLYPEFKKSSWNLVRLSYENHYRVHELLPFMLEKSKRGPMLYAWNLMKNRGVSSDMDASKYAELKMAYVERVSENLRENQPMHRPEVVAKFIGKKRPEHSAKMSGENNPACRPDVREKLSQNNPMKLEENKEKFRGDKNPNYGKETSGEQKEAIRRARKGTTLSDETKEKIAESMAGKTTTKVEIGGVVYDSVSGAAKSLGVNRHTIVRWVKSGKAIKLESQNYIVAIDGVEYTSVANAGRTLGLSVGTINSMIKHGKAVKLTKET